MKSDASTRLGQTNEGKKPVSKTGADGRKRVVIVKKGGNGEKKAEFAHGDRPRRENRGDRRFERGSDDGMSYNPFAALLKK